MLKAVIIDFDDTLCLTEEACFGLENAALVKMGCEPMSRALHQRTWGQPLFDAMPARSPGVDVEAFKNVYASTLAEYIESGEYDSIPQANYEALDQLIKLGKLLLILTSRTHSELKHMLEPDHLLATRIETFYYKDNTQFHKPDPRVFKELLAAHGLKPSECVYVGDSVSDAVATKQAGLYFIASLESGLRRKRDFNGHEVDRFITTFPEVVDSVMSLDP